MWAYVSQVLLPWVIPCAAMVGSIYALKNYIGIDGYLPFLEIASLGSMVFILFSYVFAFDAKEKNMLLNIIRRKKVNLGE
jgi:hypothetical protein